MVYHDLMYHVEFHGDFIAEGDYVVFVSEQYRKQNLANGLDACAGVQLLITTHNDFIHEAAGPGSVDQVDNPNQQDHGGLVRAANLIATHSGDEIFTDVQLLGGVKDGRYDPTPFDDDDEDFQGVVEDDATYTLCHADASANLGGTNKYTTGNPPQDMHFINYNKFLTFLYHTKTTFINKVHIMKEKIVFTR